MSNLDLSQLDDVRDNLIREIQLTNEDHGKPGGSTCVDGVVSGVLMALKHHCSPCWDGHLHPEVKYSVERESYLARTLDDQAQHCESELDNAILKCAAALHHIRVAWRQGEAAQAALIKDVKARLLRISEQVQAVCVQKQPVLEQALKAALRSRMEDMPDDHPRSPFPIYPLQHVRHFDDLCVLVTEHVRRCACLLAQKPDVEVMGGPSDDSTEERRGYSVYWPAGPVEWACYDHLLGMRFHPGIWVEAGSGSELILYDDR